MKNLAGSKEADDFIRRELERCRIPVKLLDERTTGEVKQSVTGDLEGFTLRRAWYYWVVEGPVPLEVAQELYDDPVGKTDVRVAGHCGCPPPEKPWTTVLSADGREVCPRSEYDKMVAYVDKGLIDAKYLKKYVCDDEPEAACTATYVMSYHIDSEIGLRLFVDTLRKHGIV